MDQIKRHFNKLILKEEFMTRLNVMNSDINVKLTERPTITYFKKALHTYDDKIEHFNVLLEE